ncbi:MAG TPA: fluoride efflux transporter CrcB [Treponemataceae bacterium]|nr:fluoride efflux transporter CrcB [Treponemataceae bacterium]
MPILEVFIGGGIGAVCRFLLSRQINYLGLPTKFPVGTFIVNMLGCFAIGLLFQAIADNLVPKRFQLLLVTGFLGGFTTFSSFSLETVNLFGIKDFSAGLANMLLSTVLGVAFVALGILAAAALHRAR